MLHLCRAPPVALQHSSRTLQQVIGRNGPICLSACNGGASVQSQDLQCPSGYSPKVVDGAIVT